MRRKMNKLERMSVVWKSLMKTTFMNGPTMAHQAVEREGGLLQHCLRLWSELETLTEQNKIKWSDPCSPFIIAMLHRAYEVDAYYHDHDYRCWVHKCDKAHCGTESIKFAEQLGIALTDEERWCILKYTNRYDTCVMEYPNMSWLLMAENHVCKQYGGVG